jgi:hypothetical protein
MNLMTFYGSCGHTEVTEITEAEWLVWAFEQTPVRNAVGMLVGPNYWVMSADQSARMVYVYPARYCACSKCIKGMIDEGSLDW